MALLGSNYGPRKEIIVNAQASECSYVDIDINYYQVRRKVVYLLALSLAYNDKIILNCKNFEMFRCGH